jgi:hypothetical protein
MIFHPTSSPYDDEELGTDWVAGVLVIKFCEAVTFQPQQLPLGANEPGKIAKEINDCD